MRTAATRRKVCPAAAALLAAMASVACGVGGAQIGSSAPNVTPASLTLNASSLNFGNVSVGSTGSNSLILTNASASGGPNITFSQVSVAGSGFTVTTATLPIVLAPGASSTIAVTFTPKTVGAATGSLSITVQGASDPSTVTLTGTGTAVQQVAAGQLTASPSALSFGNIVIGASQTLPATLTNSGGSSVTITQATASGGAYSTSGLALPMTLSPGQSAQFSVVFAPQSAGTANFNLSIVSNASNSTLLIALAGTGVTPGVLTAGAPALNFGNVTVSSNQSLPETLTNTGGSNVTITQAVAGTGYIVNGLNLPLTIGAGQTTSFSVMFSPQSSGSDNSSLTITNTGSTPTFTVSLTGNAVTAGTLSLSPATFSFGSVTVGATQTLAATLKNTGGTSVTVTQTAFSGGSYATSGLNLPATLQAGQGVSFNVVFAPQSVGTYNFNFSISSNASNPTLTVPVSGSAVATTALTASAANLSFGSVVIGSSQTLPETLTNGSGSGITLTQATAGGAYSVSDLTLPMTLNAGQSVSFSVTFAPTTAGSSNATLAIANNSSVPTFSIPLAGTGVTPGALAVTSVSFGSVQVGSTSSQTATMTDTGGASVTVSQANLTGTGFAMNGLSLPLTLTAGQSFTFTVTFAPQSAGSSSGSITLVSTAPGNTPSISLSGTGTAAPQFSVSPGSLSFGSVVVGASTSLSAKLGATVASVTVTSASVNSPAFSLSGLSFPTTIPAGGTASFTVIFTPQSSGAASATISFVTNAPGSPAIESLTGTGTAPPQHSVTLSWTESSSGVAGYNIYRSGTSGGPYTKLDASADTNTSYTDSTVQAGQTYYYVLTAVGTNGTESNYSSQVSAVVPTP